MEKSKMVYLIQSSLNIKCLYKCIILWLSLTAVIFSGCKKEEINNDEYYVKYEVNSSTIYSGGKLNVNINNEKGENTPIIIDTRSIWEITIGPVKKGFDAKVSVSEAGNNYGKLKLYTKISVSKNGSPFAVKQNDGSDEPRTAVQIFYTIDY